MRAELGVGSCRTWCHHKLVVCRVPGAAALTASNPISLQLDSRKKRAVDELPPVDHTLVAYDDFAKASASSGVCTVRCALCMGRPALLPYPCFSTHFSHPLPSSTGLL